MDENLNFVNARDIFTIVERYDVEMCIKYDHHSRTIQLTVCKGGHWTQRNIICGEGEAYRWDVICSIRNMVRQLEGEIAREAVARELQYPPDTSGRLTPAFTPADVRSMSRSQVRENLSAINESMKGW